MEKSEKSVYFSERARQGKRAGCIGIGCNLTLAAMKLLAGILSGSVALAADGVNNLADGASSVITAVGFRLACKPADESHPFGHARYEYISGLFVAILILFAGLELAKSALTKILHPTDAGVTGWMMAILVFSIAVKAALWRYFRHLGTDLQSGALAATADDCRNDCITTAMILLCAGVEKILPVHLDGWAGMAVSAFILVSGGKLLKDMISPLLGAKPSEDFCEDLRSLLLADENVLGIHELLIHDYGPGRLYASAHAELSAKLSAVDAHNVVDALEKQAKTQYGVELVLHCDPVREDEQM